MTDNLLKGGSENSTSGMHWPPPGLPEITIGDYAIITDKAFIQSFNIPPHHIYYVADIYNHNHYKCGWVATLLDPNRNDPVFSLQIGLDHLALVAKHPPIPPPG